jgi:hypothetical protein
LQFAASPSNSCSKFVVHPANSKNYSHNHKNLTVFHKKNISEKKLSGPHNLL